MINVNVTTEFQIYFQLSNNRAMLGQNMSSTTHEYKFPQIYHLHLFALIQQDISRRIFSTTVECRKFLGRKCADLVVVEFDPILVFLLTCQCAARNERNVMS
jgi:hypothetical protein